jgi:excisionase family DNA binding protein
VGSEENIMVTLKDALEPWLREIIRSELQALGRPPPEADELLTVEQAASLLGVTPRWLYKHKAQLPHRQLSRKALRFSKAGLQRWLAARRG